MNGADYFDQVVAKELAQCQTAAQMLEVLELHFELNQSWG